MGKWKIYILKSKVIARNNSPIFSEPKIKERSINFFTFHFSGLFDGTTLSAAIDMVTKSYKKSIKTIWAGVIIGFPIINVAIETKKTIWNVFTTLFIIHKTILL